MIKFLDLVSQYRSLQPEIDAAMRTVIEEAAFVGGRHVAAFEQAFADYLGVRHCVGVGNGTDAIEIALEALELPPGSEVIVPANSFIATSEAVSRSGHRVVMADIEPGGYGLDPDDVARRLSDRTRAIIPVHLYGQPCNLDALLALAERHDLWVIEDCAQAHGAEYRGRRVGGFGDLATFSFYPGKNLGAYGDGGAIVGNSDDLAGRCRLIANHGRTGKYDHLREGRNSRLDGLQAAVLKVKLAHLDRWIAARNAQARRYVERLAGVGDLVLPQWDDQVRHSFHLFVVRSERRDALAQWLAEAQIQTGIHYPTALPRLPAYRHLGQAGEAMRANVQDRQLLSLPIGEHLTPADVDTVAAAITAFFAAAR